MPDVHTQTLMTRNRIETVLQNYSKLRQAKNIRTYILPGIEDKVDV